MNRANFEQHVSNLWLFICICLSEIIIIIWTWLFKNSQLVKDITDDTNLNTISRAFKIIQLDDYYPHLIVGIIWIFILLGLVLYSFKYLVNPSSIITLPLLLNSKPSNSATIFVVFSTKGYPTLA